MTTFLHRHIAMCVPHRGNTPAVFHAAFLTVLLVLTFGTLGAQCTATFTAPADLCLDTGLQAGLSGGTPTGGVYSGAGVTDDGNGMTYSFDPAAAGVGTHALSYTYTQTSLSLLGQDIDAEAADDESGRSVSLSSDGSRVAIGAIGNGPIPGQVRIYSTVSCTSTANDDIEVFDPLVVRQM